MAAGIADLIAGKPYAVIAKKHGVNVRMVRRWAASDEVREAIAHAKEEALEQLQRVGARASSVLARLLSSDDERIRQTTAIAVLDRIGVIKSERHELEDVTQPRTVEEARAKLAELAAKSGGRVTWDEAASEEGGDHD